MAQLFPENFNLATLPYSEQRAVTALLEGLDDTWIVLPNVPITLDGTDSEIDCVLVSIDHGVFVAETKGGGVKITEGVWQSNGKDIRDPSTQVAKAKHSLIRRLKKMNVDLTGIFIQQVVLLPDIIDFPDIGAGPSCPREIVFTKTDLSNPEPNFAALRRDNQPLSTDSVVSFLRALRPDVTEIEVSGHYFAGVSQRLERSTQSNLSTLLPLDENRFLYVTGSAGTGKTYLATSWAQRALDRGERTLVVCYNRFLGSEIHQTLNTYVEKNDIDTAFHAGSFHAVAKAILGPVAPEVPEDASQEWWDTAYAQAIIDNSAHLDAVFDTVILDEGQDFFPLWITALQTLQSMSEPGRFFVTSDHQQAIYATPWVPSSEFARVPLQKNLRNSRTIAELVQAFGGVATPPFVPQGPHIEVVRVGGLKERRKAVNAAIKRVNESLRIPLAQILVLAPHRSDVDELTQESTGDYTLATWLERTEDTVVCGTIHGTKGLERAAVIVTCMDETLDPALFYIAASRAVTSLTIIGHDSFLASVGLSVATKN